MARRRRPLRAVSLVFVGFVTLAVLSQITVHIFSVAVPRDLQAKDQAVLTSIQQTSTELALAASALGLIFAGAVLVITRQIISADVEVYRATGLSETSAYLRLLRSHSVGPLGWVVGATAVAALLDAYVGLDALIPIGLAVCFAALLFAWLGFVTSSSFAQQALSGGSKGRSG